MAEHCHGIDQEGVAFTLCLEGHLHCAMRVETISTPALFLALANGLQSQLDDSPDDTVIPVSLIIPCLYNRTQVEAMIVELHNKVIEYQTLATARAIREARQGFEG